MFAEIDFLGAFMPAIAVWFVAVLPVFAIADALLAKTGFYRLFWHAPLVRFALLVCTFCAGGLLLSIN